MDLLVDEDREFQTVGAAILKALDFHQPIVTDDDDDDDDRIVSILSIMYSLCLLARSYTCRTCHLSIIDNYSEKKSLIIRPICRSFLQFMVYNIQTWASVREGIMQGNKNVNKMRN